MDSSITKWKANLERVNQFELRERCSTSTEIRLQQADGIMRLGFCLGCKSRGIFDPTIVEVRERWRKLRAELNA